jgi:hypothetical protein
MKNKSVNNALNLGHRAEIKSGYFVFIALR